MRKLLVLGTVVATAAVVYAAAGERLTLDGLRALFGRNRSLPALRSDVELPFRYPAALYREGVEGEVLLKIHVTEMGVVDSVEISRSSGHPGLDTIAVRGARRLLYHPALEGEDSVAVWAVLPVRFQRANVTAIPGDG